MPLPLPYFQLFTAIRLPAGKATAVVPSSPVLALAKALAITMSSMLRFMAAASAWV